ncbi:hypothetical protein [Nonomuraea aurantiaca]|uniref:hypothetical protein n=1 Tax=Nonomuraea aurantiaca TaxID=2878562 RepID=UPI0027DF2952|nr:hypothetical protein [Nonomuraea aurantiaca]
MSWETAALDLLAAGAPTPLIEFPVGAPGVTLLLKDESAQPTGSLRHRHARALPIPEGGTQPPRTVTETEAVV